MAARSCEGAAAWPSGLGRGLQSPVRRFDSARRLKESSLKAVVALVLAFGERLPLHYNLANLNGEPGVGRSPC
jgi:hypothetical protein